MKKKNKTLGVVLLVLVGLAVLGGIGNGTFENLGDKNIGFYIGFFGMLGLMFFLGIANLVGKEDNQNNQ